MKEKSILAQASAGESALEEYDGFDTLDRQDAQLEKQLAAFELQEQQAAK
ncbi:hypothetical protein AAKU64_004019 [Undibacterium sp. GrIS 1.8]